MKTTKRNWTTEEQADVTDAIISEHVTIRKTGDLESVYIRGSLFATSNVADLPATCRGAARAAVRGYGR